VASDFEMLKPGAVAAGIVPATPVTILVTDAMTELAQPSAPRNPQPDRARSLPAAPTMNGMSETDPGRAKLGIRLFVLGLPLLAFVFEFAWLLITFLVLAWIAPDPLGEVAVRPAMFAALIALVKLPMTLAHWATVSGRFFTIALITGEVPTPPVRAGWRRVFVKARDHAADLLAAVAAALIVISRMADPGEVRVWQLVAIIVLGPLLLAKLAAAPFRLLRWRWRTRPSYQPRHTRPDEEPVAAASVSEPGSTSAQAAG